MAEFKKGEYLTAVKNITGNEWVYEGENFKTESFPEVLIIEAAAQAAFLFYRLNTLREVMASPDKSGAKQSSEEIARDDRNRAGRERGESPGFGTHDWTQTKIGLRRVSRNYGAPK